MRVLAAIVTCFPPALDATPCSPAPCRVIVHVLAAGAISIARPHLMGKVLPALLMLAKEVRVLYACVTCA